MSTRLLTWTMALAYRQARRSGARVWWIVLLVAWLVRRSDRREDSLERLTVRAGHEVDVVVSSPAPE